jgi:hypothetical protein
MHVDSLYCIVITMTTVQRYRSFCSAPYMYLLDIFIGTHAAKGGLPSTIFIPVLRRKHVFLFT